MTDRWHRGSRFWQVAPWVLAVSVGLSLYFDEPSVWVTVTSVVMVGAGGKSMIDERNKRREYSDDLPSPEEK